jgi:hypothetical protein
VTSNGHSAADCRFFKIFIFWLVSRVTKTAPNGLLYLTFSYQSCPALDRGCGEKEGFMIVKMDTGRHWKVKHLSGPSKIMPVMDGFLFLTVNFRGCAYAVIAVFKIHEYT